MMRTVFLALKYLFKHTSLLLFTFHHSLSFYFATFQISPTENGSLVVLRPYSIRVIIFKKAMWLLNWFKSTLESLGLVNKKAKIVFLGLDDAGKSTLLLRLKEDVMKQLDPTQQPYSEELTMGKITFKAWDLGGHEAARKTWRNYVSDVDGIIYLVDSSNGKRFEESRIELQGILEMPELEKVPIVILGNKIDKAGAVPENELREALGIEGKNEWDKGSRPIDVFMCSVAKKKGYAEGFKWLSTFLK